MSSWLNMAREKMIKMSLRKGLLRSDIHIAFPSRVEAYDDTHLSVLIKNFLEAASLRGLDIVGIVSDWLRPGQLAQQLVQEKNIDIYVLAGQEIITEDGMGILAFNIPQEVPQRLSWEEALKTIHQMGGMAVVIRPARRWVQRLNKIIDEDWAPEGIEVYNPNFMEYIDIDADPKYEFFMTSAAQKPNDLLESRINTQNDRSWWVKHGLMQEETGKDYLPDYLQEGGVNNGLFS